MMSARQFAEKYPEQVVKLTEEGARQFGVKPITIGTVVGFRPGTKGIVGSSKVAVWRGELAIVYELSPQTGKTFTSVVPNPPNHRGGIYFLSVNWIEPLTKHKDVVPYPNRCVRCGSPARNGKNIVICSNTCCKSNRDTIKSLGNFPRIKLKDEKGFILCPYCQSRNINFAGYGGDQKTLVCCANKQHTWKHDWKDGQKVMHGGATPFLWSKGSLKQLPKEK